MKDPARSGIDSTHCLVQRRAGRGAGHWVGRWLWVLALVHGASSYAAVGALRNDAELRALLEPAPQCCVIDARSAAQRKAVPLPGALVYTETLRIKPTGTVIVVADTDARTKAVADALAKRNAHDVQGVRGGLPAWQRVQAGLKASADAAGGSASFVIPHNTCEQGEPLQVFEAKPPLSPGSAKR